MQLQRLGCAGVVGADVLAVVLLRPPAQLASELGHPRQWIGRVGLDTTLASLTASAIWLVACWVGLGLVSVAGRRVPGGTGRIATRISDVVLPDVLRRVIAGSAGVGVLLAPLPATATATATPYLADRGVAAAASAGKADHFAVRAPRWASAGPNGTARATASPTRAPVQGPRTVPAPRWPSAPRGASATPAEETRPGGTGTQPTRHPTTPSADAPHPQAPAGHNRKATVQPGDCLWLIAARRLGPDATAAAIAGSWPRWYAANRSVIGDDPDLIHPGVVLRAPTAQHSAARS